VKLRYDCAFILSAKARDYNRKPIAKHGDFRLPASVALL
jgi:hypothetical protein